MLFSRQLTLLLRKENYKKPGVMRKKISFNSLSLNNQLLTRNYSLVFANNQFSYQLELDAIKRMKSLRLIAFCTLSLVCLVNARPQKEGAYFTSEAIRQAQNTQLIPAGAQIQKVQEGLEVASFESIPGNERINLFQILKDHVPEEVVSNLQSQVDQVGKS